MPSSLIRQHEETSNSLMLMVIKMLFLGIQLLMKTNGTDNLKYSIHLIFNVTLTI